MAHALAGAAILRESARRESRAPPAASTRCSNRSLLDNGIGNTRNHAQRNGTQHCRDALDLDEFERVDDHFSHEAGR